MKRACRLSLLPLALLVASCAKKQEAPRRTEPWLASAVASAKEPAPSAPFELRFTSESRIAFSLPGRKAKPTGQVPLAQGKLLLDPRDLKASTASIDCDLTRISLTPDTSTDDSSFGDGSPSALALDWLELGPQVPAERRTQFSLARFELTSLENLSTNTLDLASKRPVRVRASAVGTLLIHGFRAPVRVEVELSVLPPGPGDQVRLSIRSVSPLVLPLAPHEIVARSPAGVMDRGASARAEASIGKNARIDLELVAEAPR